ncbi:MAG: ATP-binding protein [Candidatus Omnitrophica bacterium]|nr:ATP-binding protein [Candidatus Omnitrophota bacterium]
MIAREAESKLKELARRYPVVLVTGPRQSGKTLLCKKLFRDKPYALLENPDTLEFAVKDPRGFLAQYPEGAVLDEVQKAPQLLSYLQGIVDEKNRPGLFILTGSQYLLLLEKVSQTLAGRLAVFKLLPLTLKEARPFFQKADLNRILLTGFFPRIHNERLSPTEALANYFETYVERDVRQIVNVKNLLPFRRFVKLCAGRVGQLLNLSNLGLEAGVSHTTAREWLSVLEASFIVFLLPPYFKNFNKRIVKSPKLYFHDVGLAGYLLDIENPSHVSAHPARGALFENLVILDILKHRYNQGKSPNLYFFRDASGHEVDLLTHAGQEITGVEIKVGQTITEDYFKGLEFLEKLTGGKHLRKYLVYGGEETQVRSRVRVVPYSQCGGLF